MPTEPTPPVSTPDPPRPPPSSPPDVGLLERALAGVFGKSWKTGLAGFLVLAAGVVPFVPGAPPWLVEISRQAVPILAGAGLFVSKDSDVTGGKR